jgi:hypothetical protein
LSPLKQLQRTPCDPFRSDWLSSQRLPFFSQHAARTQGAPRRAQAARVALRTAPMLSINRTTRAIFAFTRSAARSSLFAIPTALIALLPSGEPIPPATIRIARYSSALGLSATKGASTPAVRALAALPAVAAAARVQSP